MKLRFQVAGTGDSYNDQSGRSPTRARPSCSAWTRRGRATSTLNPKKTDPTAATSMVQAYSPGALDQSDKVVRAYELVDRRHPEAHVRPVPHLAIYSDVRRPDAQGRSRARQGAALAPKDQRTIVKQQIDTQKCRCAQAGHPVRRRDRSDEERTLLSFAAAPL